MLGKGRNFGQRIEDKREEEALLYPGSFLEPGVVGVTVDWRQSGGPNQRQNNNGFGYSRETVERRYREHFDVVVMDEHGQPVSERSVPTIRFLPAVINRFFQLYAVAGALNEATNYGQYSNVPVVTDKTHAVAFDQSRHI